MVTYKCQETVFVVFGHKLEKETETNNNR